MASSNWLTLTIVWLLLAASVLVEANKSNLFDKSSTSSEKLSDKDRYIVLLKDAETSAVPTLAATLASTYGATLGYTYKKLLPGAFSVSKLTTQAAEALKQDERVKDVVQDRIIRVSDVQTSNLPWGLDRIDDEALPRDFSYEYPGDVAGQDVHIYIIDTGINYNHNDLKDRLSTSSSANFAPGVATDPAWNDCNGHGTHVASTAAGTKYGVAKKATLHAVKVFDCDGNTLSSSIVSAMEWASENCDGRLCVANMSLGGGRDEYFNQATNAMVATGMVVVVAAGNEDQDACGTSPASAQDAITVGSTIIGSISGNDERSYFSNFGSCLDIYAPVSSAERRRKQSPKMIAILVKRAFTKISTFVSFYVSYRDPTFLVRGKTIVPIVPKLFREPPWQVHTWQEWLRSFYRAAANKGIQPHPKMLSSKCEQMPSET